VYQLGASVHLWRRIFGIIVFGPLGAAALCALGAAAPPCKIRETTRETNMTSLVRERMGVNWMRAGCGIVHSERTAAEDRGREQAVMWFILGRRIERNLDR